MTGRVAALLAVLLLLGGCRLHHEASEEASTTSHRITVNGVARTYLVHTPLRLPPKAPLVVMIHAGAGSGEPSSAAQAEAEYGWDGLAEDRHFLVAYPDGLPFAAIVGPGGYGSGRARRRITEVWG